MVLTPEEVARAEDIHRAHAQGVREILNNANLSAEGRGTHLDDIFDQAEGQLDGLYARANQRDQADGQRAYQQAFGLPGSGDSALILAHRDARDRLANASPAETAQMLDHALNSGDETLARAAGERAFQMAGPNDLGGHYAATLEKFAGSTPARQRAVGQLAGQLADRMDSKTVVRDKLLRHVRKPVEIQHGNARARAAARRAALEGGS
jgi:hypothetical protein